MSAKLPGIVKAIALALSLGACHATTDGESEESEGAAESAAPLLIGGCTFKVDRPHKSTHVPGTVNVVARIQCNRIVERIEMTLGLARGGVELARRTFAEEGRAYLQGNVAVPCVSGTYNGAAAATVTFPAGSFPRTGSGSAGSGDVDIVC